MDFRGIIFDFNGVLFWDADLQVLSWQPVARKLRGYEMTPQELDTQMHGRPNAYVLSYLAGRPIDGQELKDLIEVKEGYYRSLCLQNPDEFVLSPGAEPLLEALVAAAIPRTIATSSEITNVRFFIEHLQLARWFDVSQIVYDDGTRPGKPAPDIYKAAAANLGLAPKDCVVVEDAVSGIASAHAAGIGHLIGLAQASERARIAECPGVAEVIESLGEFPRALLIP
jgi:beta-phosphoglucomutase-like phosphatase (HAD superfamily)